MLGVDELARAQQGGVAALPGRGEHLALGVDDLREADGSLGELGVGEQTLVALTRHRGEVGGPGLEGGLDSGVEPGRELDVEE